MSLRALELFAGIGGFAAAVQGRAEVVAAIDTSALCAAAYQANWPHPFLTRNLAVRSMRLPEADLWWASPPCQPYTVRGARRDLDDPRAESFLLLLDRLSAHRPRYFAMENVPGFAGSRAHAALHARLDALGYARWETLLCPTSLGEPVERRRYYLVAGRDGLGPPPRLRPSPTPLSARLDPAPAPELDASEALVARFGDALHVVDTSIPDGIIACFTSAYGRSPVYAGSYLRDRGRLRLLSPAEGLRLLGFPSNFRLPEVVGPDRAWGLVGNSLSVHAVRFVLGVIPELSNPGLDFVESELRLEPLAVIQWRRAQRLIDADLASSLAASGAPPPNDAAVALLASLDAGEPGAQAAWLVTQGEADLALVTATGPAPGAGARAWRLHTDPAWSSAGLERWVERALRDAPG